MYFKNVVSRQELSFWQRWVYQNNVIRTMLSRNYFHCYIGKMEKWVLNEVRKKFNIFKHQSQAGIQNCLMVPKYKGYTSKLATFDKFDILHTQAWGWVCGLGSRLFCIGKHTGRNSSISSTRPQSIALEVTCTSQTVRTFGALINEPYMQELETISVTDNIRALFQVHLQLQSTSLQCDHFS